MSQRRMDFGSRVAELREAFDRSFATIPAPDAPGTEDVLAVRIAADAYVLRVREIAAITRPGRMVPLPSRKRELLGLTGFKGDVMPVYSLAVLLGYKPAIEAASWMVLCDSREPVGFTFGSLEGCHSIALPDLAVGERRSTERRHVTRFVRLGGSIRGIVDLPSVVQAVKGGARGTGAVPDR